MTNAILKALCLDEHPFAPKEDPKRKYNFAQNNVSLRGTLPIFQHPQLVDYYVRIGAFSNAVKDIEKALSDRDYPATVQSAPAVLIYGKTAVGRSSLAEYIAHIIRERWKAARPMDAGGPTLRRVKIEGENIAKLMVMLKIYVKAHLESKQVTEAAPIFEMFKDDGGVADPQEIVLEQLFTELATVAANVPPLILILRTITPSRLPWLGRLTTLLAPTNVIPVFITDTPNVFSLATDQVPNVVRVRLDPLTAADGEAFLKVRVGAFRDPACTHVHSDLFPFDTDTVIKTFAGRGALGVRLLVEVMGGALDELIRDLSNIPPGTQAKPDDLMVQWRHVGEGYKKLLSPQGAAARQGTRQ